jgi:hypothetical protein
MIPSPMDQYGEVVLCLLTKRDFLGTDETYPVKNGS